MKAFICRLELGQQTIRDKIIECLGGKQDNDVIYYVEPLLSDVLDRRDDTAVTQRTDERTTMTVAEATPLRRSQRKNDGKCPASIYMNWVEMTEATYV